MRETKVKVWNREEKKMYWLDLMWGGKHHRGDGWLFAVPFGEERKYTGGLGGRDNRSTLDPSDCEFMQFIGRKDKNGKEICRGDIVKSLWQHDGVTNYDYEVIGEIKYSLMTLQYVVEFRDNQCNTSWNYPLHSFEREELLEDGFEIIGNIYETPELLPQREGAKG